MEKEVIKEIFLIRNHLPEKFIYVCHSPRFELRMIYEGELSGELLSLSSLDVNCSENIYMTPEECKFRYGTILKNKIDGLENCKRYKNE